MHRALSCFASSSLWAAALTLMVSGCGGEGGPVPEEREPCAEHHPERTVYFGDLHAHTVFSFDALGYRVTVTPDEAYRFAQGDSVWLPPLDDAGEPTREVRLARPLDFVMLTDHSEFLGEVSTCLTPGEEGYDSEECVALRAGGEDGVFAFGFQTSLATPRRFDWCGDDRCAAAGEARWGLLQEAAEAHYDRSSSCSFVTFIGYEYTNTLDVANNHRNVIFRGRQVTPRPIGYYEAPTPQDLWQALADECLDAGNGCDAMSIAHNSNLSNGNEFGITFAGASTEEEQRRVAELRARVEPLVEVFQQKGSTECRDGFSVGEAASDPDCDFEQVWPVDAEDCGDATGAGGMRLWGCLSRLDFVRNVFLAGLEHQRDLGVNPFRMGVVGGTDTHNGTPGKVEEESYPGHVGTVDDTPAKRLGAGDTVTHDTIINNPGGLTAVWAEERSRSAIFDAMRRGEVYSTSGPRIAVRFFGGDGLPDGLCDDPTWVTTAYADGVPMGGDLPAGTAAPTFIVWAQQDAGTDEMPGTPLQRVQVIKGVLAADGTLREEVIDVAAADDDPGTVDPATCAPSGHGAAELCAVWRDPDFDPAEHAFYYARVLQSPTCRWNAWECLGLAPEERPIACDDPPVPKVVQERAWSSPIWYSP